MLNTGFGIYPTGNWWIPSPLLFHYHIFIHMPKRQTIICTQHILQWNWFAIVPFFRCLNLHIIFLCFKYFSSKDRIFVNVKWITSFCKCRIIKCFICVLFYSESLEYYLFWQLFLVFIIFSVFLTLWVTKMGILWLFIMRLNYLSWMNWIFSQVRTCHCCYAFPSM